MACKRDFKKQIQPMLFYVYDFTSKDIFMIKIVLIYCNYMINSKI